MAKAKYRNILRIFLLAVFMLVGSVYAIDILAQQDEDMNVTGTSYEDSYEGNQKLQEVTVTLFALHEICGLCSGPYTFDQGY